MMEDVLKDTIAALPKALSLDNCIEIFNFSLSANHLDIFKLCDFYIRSHLHYVLKHSDIGNLDFNHFRRFISDDSLKHSADELIWSSITKWVSVNVDQRLEYVPWLLCSIRIEDCSERCVQEIVNHPFVLNNDDCRIAVSQARIGNSDVLNAERFVELVKSAAEQAACHDFGEAQILCTGRHRMEEQLSFEIGLSLFAVDFSTKSKTVARRHDFRLSNLFYVYPFVYIYQKDPQKIYRFDIIQDEWSSPALPPFRCAAYFVSVDSTIYAVWINSFCKSLSISGYNSSSNEWFYCTSTALTDAHDVKRLMAASLGGLIYTIVVVTTLVENETVAFGNVYDPEKDKWEKFRMPKSHKLPYRLIAYDRDLVILEGKVWTVRIMDPKDKIWKFSEMLPHPYAFPRAVVLNNRLIIYEKQGIETISYPVYWDSASNKWCDASSFFTAPMVGWVIKEKDVVQKFYRSILSDEWRHVVNEFAANYVSVS